MINIGLCDYMPDLPICVTHFGSLIQSITDLRALIALSPASECVVLSKQGTYRLVGHTAVVRE